MHEPAPTYHLAAKMRRFELDQKAAQTLAKVLLESGHDLPAHRNTPRLVDAERLRGLPAVGGRGSCGGAIRGTQPGYGLR